MTPEIQVMVQATQYIMAALQHIYTLLATGFALAAGVGFMNQLSHVIWMIKWEDHLSERIMGWVTMGLWTSAVFIAVRLFV